MINFYDSPEEFKNVKLVCHIGVAIVGAAAIGGAATVYSASQAADAQSEAAQAGINAQQQNYAVTRQDLAPYRQAGGKALTELQDRLPYLTSDIDVDKLLLDPNSTARKAYDFTKTQGLKAVQNSAAARGLGNSGAALKGAANFTTGLADNTYKSLFDMENVNRTNAYNRLKSLVDTGQNASAQTGSVGTNTANQIGALSVGAGNAQAAAWNATGGAINNAANNIGGYYAYKGLYGGGGAGGGWTEPTGNALAPGWYSG